MIDYMKLAGHLEAILQKHSFWHGGLSGEELDALLQAAEVLEQVGKQEPVALAVQASEDGSFANRIAPTNWMTFEEEKEKLLNHSWIKANRAKIVSLYAAPVLRAPASRDFIAQHIADWLKREHPMKEKVLPTSWLGENGAELIANALDKVLMQVSEDPAHQLRENFDEAVKRFIDRLKVDPAFLEKGEEIKRYVRDGEIIGPYIKNLWAELRNWLKQDLLRSDSALHEKVADVRALGAHLGPPPGL